MKRIAMVAALALTGAASAAEIKFVEYIATTNAAQFIDCGVHFAVNHRLTFRWANAGESKTRENIGWGADNLISGGRVQPGSDNVTVWFGRDASFSPAIKKADLKVGEVWEEVVTVLPKLTTVTAVKLGDPVVHTACVQTPKPDWESGCNITLASGSEKRTNDRGVKRLYRATYETLDGKTVFDLVPVTVDGAPALYDLVSKKTFANAEKVPEVKDKAKEKPKMPAPLAAGPAAKGWRLSKGACQVCVTASGSGVACSVDGGANFSTTAMQWVSCGAVVKSKAKAEGSKLVVWTDTVTGRQYCGDTRAFKAKAPVTLKATLADVQYLDYVATSNGQQFVDCGQPFSAGHRFTCRWAKAEARQNGENQGWGANEIIGGGRIRPGTDHIQFWFNTDRGFSPEIRDRSIRVGDPWEDVVTVLAKTTTVVSTRLEGVDSASFQTAAPTPFEQWNSGLNLTLGAASPVHNNNNRGPKRFYRATYATTDGKKLFDYVPVSVNGKAAMLNLVSHRINYGGNVQAPLIKGPVSAGRRLTAAGTEEIRLTVTVPDAASYTVNGQSCKGRQTLWIAAGAKTQLNASSVAGKPFVWLRNTTGATANDAALDWTQTEPCEVSFILPTYTCLTFLESTGTQAVTVAVNASDTLEAKLDFTPLARTDRPLFGSYGSVGEGCWRFTVGDWIPYFQVGSTTTTGDRWQLRCGEGYHVVCKADRSGHSFSVYDLQTGALEGSRSGSFGGTTAAHPIRIFNGERMRFHAAKFSSDGTYVSYLVPVLAQEGGVKGPGLYDVLAKRFFPSVWGVESFKCGETSPDLRIAADGALELRVTVTGPKDRAFTVNGQKFTGAGTAWVKLGADLAVEVATAQGEAIYWTNFGNGVVNANKVTARMEKPLALVFDLDKRP